VIGWKNLLFPKRKMACFFTPSFSLFLLQIFGNSLPHGQSKTPQHLFAFLMAPWLSPPTAASFRTAELEWGPCFFLYSLGHMAPRYRVDFEVFQEGAVHHTSLLRITCAACPPLGPFGGTGGLVLLGREIVIAFLAFSFLRQE